MIVLDTNVISELVRLHPDPAVVRWMDAERAENVSVSAITAAELHYGVGRLPPGRRRSNLGSRIHQVLSVGFANQVIGFDAGAAKHYGEIVAARERSGRPIAVLDAQIAATCRSHGARLATRNVRDFEGTGIDLINPWLAA